MFYYYRVIKMNDEIRREVRALVQEELNETPPSNGSIQRTQQRQDTLNLGPSPSPAQNEPRQENLNFGQSPVQNLLNRTRNLIRNSVSTSVHELNNFNSRSTPGHSERNTR